MPQFRVRVAAVDDAPAMGRVMVESFLSAHRGQMPDAAFQKRVDEWTPEVSAAGWARALTGIADGNPERDVILVAEDDGGLLGLGAGGAAEGVRSSVRRARLARCTSTLSIEGKAYVGHCCALLPTIWLTWVTASSTSVS